MRPFRNLKIASLIEAELGKILTRDFYVENTLVTITNILVDEDFLRARVKIAIIPYEKGPEVFTELEKQRRNFQHQLLKKINIKPMPQIRFEIEDNRNKE
ncbi:MAG: ribosome-binding factor A [Patescibacteria group bacterium]